MNLGRAGFGFIGWDIAHLLGGKQGLDNLLGQVLNAFLIARPEGFAAIYIEFVLMPAHQ